MKMRYGTWIAVLMGGLIMASCSPPESGDTNDQTGIENRTAEIKMQMDAPHRRVMQECSQAMKGSWDTYNETNWPTATTYASYAYTSADSGAWNLLMSNYGGVDPNGVYHTAYNVSCRYDSSTVYYTPCNITYGSHDTMLSRYTCQGNCPATYNHGGECYAFMNLLAYRSGVYQKPNYGFRIFPSDNCIRYTTATCNLPAAQKVLRPAADADMPLVPNTTLVPGDFLRNPGVHALIVVSTANSPNITVLDSNSVSPDHLTYEEIVGSHVKTLSDLAAYRVLKCAYNTTNTCSSN
jgi:hypothetical protein